MCDMDLLKLLIYTSIDLLPCWATFILGKLKNTIWKENGALKVKFLTAVRTGLDGESPGSGPHLLTWIG